jgi:hypothetical protein
MRHFFKEKIESQSDGINRKVEERNSGILVIKTEVSLGLPVFSMTLYSILVVDLKFTDQLSFSMIA